MEADREWFNQCHFSEAEFVGSEELLVWNVDVFSQCTIALHPHGFIVTTSVEPTSLTSRTLTAAGVRRDQYVLSDFPLRGHIRANRFNRCADFVARDARVSDHWVEPTEGGEVRAAEADLTHFEAHFACTRCSWFWDVDEFTSIRFGDTDGFHS